MRCDYFDLGVCTFVKRHISVLVAVGGRGLGKALLGEKNRMIDKKLFGLIGDKKGSIRSITILNALGLIFNLCFSALICLCLYTLSVIKDPTISDIAINIGLIVGIVVLRFISSKILGDIKIKLGDDIKVLLRSRLLEKSLSLGASRKNYIADAGMCQVSIEGVEQLDAYFTTFIPAFIYGMIAPIMLFVVAVFIEWKTAVVLLVALPLIPFTIMKVTKFAKKTFNKYWGRYTQMGDVFLDSLEGMRELKIFNADKEKQKEINSSAEEFRKITMKVLVMQLVSLTVMDIIAYGGAAVAIIVTLYSINAGTLGAFMGLFLILLSADFFLPMRALGSAFHIAMNGATAGKKILSILDCKEAEWGNEELKSIDSITIDNLTFGYDKERNILEDLSISLSKGLNSVVGESGSGKSTIASLMLARHKTDKVLVNGKDLFSYTKESFYSKLTYVGADSFLFNKSIRDNFLLVNENVTDEQIYEKLKLVRLDEYVRSIGGLDYILLENSENISGGQRQRIILASNLTQEKEFYIFDEATSNIDIESEEIVMSVISKIAENKVVLLISHRLNNVVNSKNINYVQDKKIKESGEHKKLIELNGSYTESYNRQSALEGSFKGAKNEV